MERMNGILVTLLYALVDPGSLHVLHSTHGLPAVKSVQAHNENVMPTFQLELMLVFRRESKTTLHVMIIKKT